MFGGLAANELLLAKNSTLEIDSNSMNIGSLLTEAFECSKSIFLRRDTVLAMLSKFQILIQAGWKTYRDQNSLGK